MRRCSELLSVGLSAAIFLMLLVQLMPKTDEAEPPEKVLQTPQITKIENQTAVSAIVLPPPPEAKASVPSTLQVSAQPIEPLSPSPAHTNPREPTSVEPLRPASPAQKVAPPVDIEPLKSNRQRPLRQKESMPPLLAEDKKTESLSVKPMTVDRSATRRNPASDEKPQAANASPAEPIVGAEEARPLMARGRPLLRLLEHGDGPRIDIAWPESAGARERLFQSFARCYGMVVALMAPDGNLYSDQSDTAPWAINLDRFSGFVRQSGQLGTSGERIWSLKILRRHPMAAGAATVRLFPRAMDALLIGGLHKLLGDDYGSAKSIDARYIQRGDAVVIDDIMANGLPVSGRIDLSHAAGRKCQSRAPKGV